MQTDGQTDMTCTVGFHMWNNCTRNCSLPRYKLSLVRISIRPFVRLRIEPSSLHT